MCQCRRDFGGPKCCDCEEGFWGVPPGQCTREYHLLYMTIRLRSCFKSLVDFCSTVLMLTIHKKKKTVK